MGHVHTQNLVAHNAVHPCLHSDNPSNCGLCCRARNHRSTDNFPSDNTDDRDGAQLIETMASDNGTAFYIVD